MRKITDADFEVITPPPEPVYDERTVQRFQPMPWYRFRKVMFGVWAGDERRMLVSFGIRIALCAVATVLIGLFFRFLAAVSP